MHRLPFAACCLPIQNRRDIERPLEVRLYEMEVALRIAYDDVKLAKGNLQLRRPFVGIDRFELQDEVRCFDLRLDRFGTQACGYDDCETAADRRNSRQGRLLCSRVSAGHERDGERSGDPRLHHHEISLPGVMPSEPERAIALSAISPRCLQARQVVAAARRYFLSVPATESRQLFPSQCPAGCAPVWFLRSRQRRGRPKTAR